MRKFMVVVGALSIFSVFASAACARSETVRLEPGNEAIEYVAKRLMVCSFKVPVRVIVDEGKSIRITSETPLTVGIVQRKGMLTITGDVKITRGASVSIYNSAYGPVNIHQETHGDGSSIINASGNVTITQGGGYSKGEQGERGITIRVPRKVFFQTKNISGDLQIIQ